MDVCLHDIPADVLLHIFCLLDDRSKFSLRATCKSMRSLGDEACTVLPLNLPGSCRLDLYVDENVAFLARLQNLRAFRVPEYEFNVKKYNQDPTAVIDTPWICPVWKKRFGLQQGAPEGQHRFPALTFENFCCRYFWRRIYLNSPFTPGGKYYVGPPATDARVALRTVQ